MLLLKILKKEFKLLLRNPGELAVLFLMPLAFIIPISFALGNGDGYGLTASNHRIPLPVANYDNGRLSKEFVQTLSESLWIEQEFSPQWLKSLELDSDPACAKSGPACNERAVRTLVEQSKRSAALIIPAEFSADIENNQQTHLQLVYDPGADNVSLQQIEGVVKGVATKISITQQVNSGMAQMKTLVQFAPQEVRDSVENQQQTPVQAEQIPAIALASVSPSNFTLQKLPDTYQQTIPGYTVMYVFFVIGFLRGSVNEERYSGTFRRLLSMPLSRAQILGGKVLVATLIGMLQVVLMFAVGGLIFRLDLGRDWAALVLLTLALALAATAMGLAAATARKTGGVIVPILIVGALLGGCMFPVDLMPPFLRGLSYFVPHSWALTGYQNLMVRGQGLVQVLPQIGVLLAFAAVFFFIALRRFDFEG
jgi:ABC-2 type transport system permease protein